jgi:hypothetical protein
MNRIALLAQWAGDFEFAQHQYDKLLTESLDREDPVEARLLYGPQVLCQLVFSMEVTREEPLHILREITREKAERANTLFDSREGGDPKKKQLIHAALRSSEKITTQAIKRLMLLPAGAREPSSPPHREQRQQRFVSVFAHPHGFEVRSYDRDDLPLDLEETKEKLRTANLKLGESTERMVEVLVESEVLEIFLDGRIRFVSKIKDPQRLAGLVFDIGKNFVARA